MFTGFEEGCLPEQKTIRAFRRRLNKAETFERFIEMFGEAVNLAGFTASKGHIVDAGGSEGSRAALHRGRKA